MVMENGFDVGSFISETWDDLKSPTTSDFTSKIQQVKRMIHGSEQVIDLDRSGLTKLKKSTKALVNSGNVHIESETVFAESLEKLGNYAMSYEQDSPEVAGAFIKFAIVAKEMSALMKTLMSNLRNTVMFPLEMYTKNDARESHIDCRKSFDKSLKDLETKFHKVEKERLRIAESAGLHRKNVTGPEVAEDTDKERKLFQLHTCEYLLKVNESKSKKGVDLLNHLVDYYQSQTSFFKDGMQTINHFNTYISSMVPKLKELKQQQDGERKELNNLRESLKAALASYNEDQQNHLRSPIQVFQNSKEVGSEKVGYLLKKSEGKIKKIWQKRRCAIKDGVMYISHSDENKIPVRLNLLTCQAKILPDDPGKKCFDLLSSSNSRTYHFQAEDDLDMIQWISVLNNAKEEQLLIAFSDDKKGTAGTENIKELRKQLIADIRKLPGNDICCDCKSPDPEWLSVNFGVLICLECCGVHRELGVHISRTQSLVIDEMGTSQLLIASVMSNEGFNDIMEAALSPEARELLIKPNSTREQRNNFIRTKYETRRYAIRTCADSDELKEELLSAVQTHDIYGLLQVYAEGLDLLSSLPGDDTRETSLHTAIKQETGTSLHIIDFLVQNSDNKKLNCKDGQGNTALHIAADYNQGEAMKLVLRANSNLATVKNAQEKTPLDLSTENKFHLCMELLQHAVDGKTSLFENVNIDWLLIQDDYVDFSDDDLDTVTVDKISRPGSLASDGTKANTDNSDTVSIRSVSSRAERRWTGECKLDAPEKRSTIDRMRRKTTDIVLPGNSSQSKMPLRLSKATGRSMTNLSVLLSNKSANSRNGSVKAKSGHSRAISDHTPALPDTARHRGSIVMTHSYHPPADAEGKKHPPPLPEKRIKTAGPLTVVPPPAQFSLPKKTTLDNEDIDSCSTTTKPLSNISNNPTKPEPMPRKSSVVPDGKMGPPAVPTASSKPSPRLKPSGITTTSLPIRRRCRALYDCVADNADELSFFKDEVIVILKSPPDSNWWQGEIDGNPKRRGLFPTTHVAVINDL